MWRAQPAPPNWKKCGDAETSFSARQLELSLKPEIPVTLLIQIHLGQTLVNVTNH
jgi:hypothetical protein